MDFFTNLINITRSAPLPLKPVRPRLTILSFSPRPCSAVPWSLGLEFSTWIPDQNFQTGLGPFRRSEYIFPPQTIYNTKKSLYDISHNTENSLFGNTLVEGVYSGIMAQTWSWNPTFDLNYVWLKRLDLKVIVIAYPG